jgi:hypothetical protein
LPVFLHWQFLNLTRLQHHQQHSAKEQYSTPDSDAQVHPQHARRAQSNSTQLPEAHELYQATHWFPFLQT